MTLRRLTKKLTHPAGLRRTLLYRTPSTTTPASNSNRDTGLGRQGGVAHQSLLAAQVEHKSPRSPVFSLHCGAVHEWELHFKRLFQRPQHRRMLACTWRVAARGSPVLFLVNCVQSKTERPVARIPHALPVEANIQLEKHFGSLLSRLIGPCLHLIIGNVACALYSVRFPLSIDAKRDGAHRNRVQLRRSRIREKEAHFNFCIQAITQAWEGRRRRVLTEGDLLCGRRRESR